MTISDDLFRAILAMDAYNRGDSPGIKDLGGVGTQIGNATISLQSDTTPGSRIVGWVRARPGGF